MRYELLGCAWNGHVLVGTDAASISPDDALVVRPADDDARWHRCLRCDAWVLLPAPVEPTRDRPAGRDEIALPLRGRPLQSRYVLRLIALTRAFNVLVLLLVLGGVVAVLVNETALRDDLAASASSLQIVFGGQAISQVQSLLAGGAGPLWLIAVGLAVLLALESAEGIGLWRGTRWGEYLTFVMTTLLLVPEVLELTSSTSPGTIIGMVVNLAVVGYLLVSKRLFGLRGGSAAVAAIRDHDVSWDALRRRLPAASTRPGQVSRSR
jgi:uncharacterized membrane protein (DUF2068 family)